MLSALLVLAYTVSAQGAPERGLPRGEDSPLVVERIFQAKEGQLEFLRTPSGGTTAWIREAGGDLIPFREFNGTSECEAWFVADNKALPGPSGCELVFFSEHDGKKTIRVSTSSLSEASLFELGSPRKRGADVAL